MDIKHIPLALFFACVARNLITGASPFDVALVAVIGGFMIAQEYTNKDKRLEKVELDLAAMQDALKKAEIEVEAAKTYVSGIKLSGLRGNSGRQ